MLTVLGEILYFLFFQILVPIANGSEEMEAVIIIDILRWAKANVVAASIEDKLEVSASRRVKLVAGMLIDEGGAYSCFIVFTALLTY